MKFDLRKPGWRFPALLAALLAVAAKAQVPETRVAEEGPASLSLEAALEEAFARSPALRAASAQVEEARGRLLGARIYPFNPELDLEGEERQGEEQTTTDRSAALVQEIEIAGQLGKRVDVAKAELGAVEAGYRREQRLIAAGVGQAFVDALAGRELAGLAEIEAELAGQLLRITERRFDAGAATQVDLNLARASAARAERRLELALALAQEARSVLAEAVGLDPAAPPEPTGPLALPSGEPAPLGELVEGALARRDDLEALRRAREASEARLRLAKAEAVPNLVLEAFQEREEGTDDILGGGVGIALPLFNRNQGGIAEARAAAERAAAETALSELAVRREVYAALARYQAERASSERLDEQVVGSLAESLDLLERSFVAGKIGLSDLLVFRSELVEGRRELIEATADAWQARITLDLAAGRLPVPGEDVSRETEPTPETDR